MKSFFASLKTEHVHQVRFRTREDAKAAVFDYVEVFYNRQRLHSGIGYRTPAQAWADMSEVSIPMAAWCADLTLPLPGEAQFVFVTRRDVPATNNSSERALRPSVMFRKVTNGFRSVRGAGLYAAICSVIATGALRRL